MRNRIRSQNTFTIAWALCGVLAFAGAAPVVEATIFFTWQGDNNNNWGNSGNWQQSPGAGDIPDHPTHEVIFNNQADRFNVDLSNGTRTVERMKFEGTGFGYRLFKGQIELQGNLFARDIDGSTVEFDSDLTVNQSVAGLWTLRPHAFNVTFNGILAGNGDIDLEGYLVLNAANPYGGELQIGQDGKGIARIRLGHAFALQNSTINAQNTTGTCLDVVTNNIDARLGGLKGTGNLNFGSTTLRVGLNDSSTTYDGVLSGSGNFRKLGTGSLTLGNANTLNGTTTILDGSIILENTHALQNSLIHINLDNGLNLNGLDASIGGLSGPGDLNITGQSLTVGTGGASGSYAGVLSGAGALYKTDSGTLTLAGVNTFAGGIAIIGGAVSVSSNANLGNSGSDIAIGSSGRLLTTDTFVCDHDLTVPSQHAGTLDVQGGTLVYDAQFIVPQDADLIKEGAELLQLVQDNLDFTGVLVINGGRVAPVADALRYCSVHVGVTNGLDLTVAPPTVNIGSLEGPADLNLSTHTLTTGFDNRSTQYDGVLSGSGSLSKVGTGTLTLTGVSTLTGGVTIEDGALVVDNASGSATGPGGVTVNGGTLTGLGQVSGLTTVNAGGAVNLGVGDGYLQVDAVDFHTSATLAVEIGGTSGNLEHGFLGVNNTATLGGTLDLSYINGVTASVGDEFIVLQAATLVGTFDAVNPPDGQTWAIDYGPENVTVFVCEDMDADGVCDADDICAGFDDNLDSDADGIPNGCDSCEGFDDNVDTDADGVPNGCDSCEGHNDTVDVDTDGVPDGCDACAGFDDNVDADSDGVANGCDFCEGFDDNVDTDADGVPDGCDACAGFDDNVDADSDGVPNGCDSCEGFDDNVDTDTDGTPDGCDACAGGFASGDTDANGSVDQEDFTDLAACLTGPIAGLGIGCECFDFDNDGDNDLLDFAEFQVLFIGIQP